MPERIQRKRTRGYRLPDGAVYVGRPTKWGNPLHWSDYPSVAYDFDGEPFAVSPAVRRRHAAVDFESALLYEGGGFPGYPSRDEIRRELAGKDLACWCPLPAPGERDYCHAAVLLYVANGGGHV